MTATVLIVEVTDTERKVRQEYTFDLSPVRVGRSALNDLPLDRSFVSHCHGVLRFEGGQCDFMDLGSTNGTYISGRRIGKDQAVPLGANTVLMIGTLELRARVEAGIRDKTRASYAFRPSDINLPAPASSPAPPASALPTPIYVQAPPSSQVHHTPPNTPYAGTPAWDSSGHSPSVAELFGRYRTSWAVTLAAVTRDMPAGVSREAYGQQLLAQYPELAQESEFRRWLGTDRGAIATPAPPNAARTPSSLGRALGVFDLGDDAALAERVALLLERFVQAFLELRRGQRQLASEVGGKPLSDDALSSLTDARSILAFLLDVRTSSARIDELSRAYADLMLHQVALINGFHAGARELVAQLSPDSLDVLRTKSPIGFLMRILGRDRRLSMLRARIEDLAEETTFSSVLMGRAFARAYAAAMGQKQPEPAAPPKRARIGRS